MNHRAESLPSPSAQEFAPLTNGAKE
jgi:hypothetical protein